jgi:carbonic anhydrase/acetyltransferase-like protein (isoleucine patch superfamily)
MPISSLDGVEPRLGARVFLAPGAWVVGDVEIGDDSSFWFHTAARGDVNWIKIGARTSVQDGTILHVSHETHPLVIGNDVVIGHSCMVHGCTIEDGALIGIGARVLDGAVVESGAQVGAGAVVAPGKTVPSGQLVMGVPARVVRSLSDSERDNISRTSARYVEQKDRYIAQLGAGVTSGPNGGRDE